MAPINTPKPRSQKRKVDEDNSPLRSSLDKKSKSVGFKEETSDEDVKNGHKNGFGESRGFDVGPHVYKVMDDNMLAAVCQKFKKIGHSVQMKNNIIKLNQMESDTSLQHEVMTNFDASLLEHTDVTLVSSNNQEVSAHRFILSARSSVFKKLFETQSVGIGEPIKESIDASTEALQAMIKYLYTDNLDGNAINEDLMNLADKYGLSQMKQLCLPFFVKKVRGDNCLKAYIYGHLHDYEPLKAKAFAAIDENWSRYESSTEITEMMKTHPNAVLEILNGLYKKKSGIPFSKPGANNTVKPFRCLQEEIINSYDKKLEFTDLMLVSSSGQEVPCHRYVIIIF